MAGEKWRLQQARHILASIVVVVPNKENEDEEPTTIRVFHKTDSSPTYKNINIIMRNEDEYLKLLERAKSELIAFKNKYKNLSELSEVFEAINNI